MTNKRTHSNFNTTKKRLSTTQKTIIAIILISSILVVAFYLYSLFFNSEAHIKGKLSTLASHYYEDYLYENLINSENINDLGEVMEEYKTSGFPTVYLRQLLYYKENDAKTISLLKEHCNENKTGVKFYPESPFSKTSYRIEYIYSCDF